MYTLSCSSVQPVLIHPNKSLSFLSSSPLWLSLRCLQDFIHFLITEFCICSVYWFIAKITLHRTCQGRRGLSHLSMETCFRDKETKTRILATSNTQNISEIHKIIQRMELSLLKRQFLVNWLETQTLVSHSPCMGRGISQ